MIRYEWQKRLACDIGWFGWLIAKNNVSALLNFDAAQCFNAQYLP
jgi:hypothetical protein